MASARKKRVDLLEALILFPSIPLVLIPALLVTFWGSGQWRYSIPAIFLGLLGFLGLALIVIGIVIIVWAVDVFYTAGRWTSAPWAPPRHLAVKGPYAFVRNPMILAALMILIGETLIFGSLALVVWCVLFWFVNTLYFVFHEEPGLARRFGQDYMEYKKHVPRWIPRQTPWRPVKKTLEESAD